MVEQLEHEVDSGAVPPDGEAISARLIEILAEIASTDRAPINLCAEPAVLLMAGVNGTGKTTTIGKIAWHLKKEFGLSVLLGAADTYRAAAAEQLDTWADRAGADIVRARRAPTPAPSPSTRSTPPGPAAPTWSSSTPPAASTPRAT